ncbi:DNA gyrase subunit B [Streptomyces roseicoloratus]|uniref:DNA topoisomerase (ATP-hydrolyzing) n=1 Tax=Streptomyces roseicoloratus TaxID=2508722 RepID=A0ABY9RTM4_9ACTN|nr:DNA gyrase subunit B [Streptomyces roseicoloratus]WMX44295.1 DNA gyrase subunit B [Streptomyces roseicoloratus]
MSEESTTYDAGTIVVLEGREAVRKRPGMYIGSVGERGLHHLVLEAAERSLSEILGGTASCVEITLTADGGVRVADDGTALTVGHAGSTDGPSLETRLTVLSCGAPPAGRHSLHVGCFGIGLAVVNALSSSLMAEVRRDGTRWVLEYERGVPVGVPARSGPADGSGTALTFRPDDEIFETRVFSFDALVERFRELAFLNRELDITLTDDRDPAAPRAVHLRFPGGPKDYLAEQSAPLHPDVIGFEREYSEMEGTVEVALRWCDSREERIASYANSLPTTDGGTHELGFRDGLAAALHGYARERRLLGPSDPDFTPAQLGAGLTAVVSVKLDSPEFEGATRSRLGNRPVRACVAEAVREHLIAWLRADPAQATTVLARISTAPRH